MTRFRIDTAKQREETFDAVAYTVIHSAEPHEFRELAAYHGRLAIDFIHREPSLQPFAALNARLAARLAYLVIRRDESREDACVQRFLDAMRRLDERDFDRGAVFCPWCATVLRSRRLAHEHRC